MKLTVEYLEQKGFKKGSEDGMIEYYKELENGYHLGIWYHSSFNKFQWDIEDGYNTQSIWLSNTDQLNKLMEFLVIVWQ